tara:strand:+ start:93 stop:833 length:741 start_codon:yes stop_codon:yes gene_type:complete
MKKDISFCVSMSTIPGRIDNINEILNKLNDQTLKPDKIFLNIPYNYKRFKNETINEEKIKKIYTKNLEIKRCDDYGPGTKIMGSLNEVKKFDCVILLDDDHLYDTNIFEIFIENFKKEKINYSFYLNKILNIKMGQCADGFLINANLLDKIEVFYEKYVKNNKNMFLDDDLWLAIYLQKEKKSQIRNLNEIFFKKTNKKIVYSQNINSKIDSLYLNEHKDGFLLNRRKIQKVEYLKYIFKSKFIWI